MSSRERTDKSIERFLKGKHGEDFAGGGGEWTFIQTKHRAWRGLKLLQTLALPALPASLLYTVRKFN